MMYLPANLLPGFRFVDLIGQYKWQRIALNLYDIAADKYLLIHAL